MRLSRKKKGHKQGHRSSREIGGTGNVENRNGALGDNVGGNQAAGAQMLPLEQILLDQVSDSDIKQNMIVLCTQIEQHVGNNYHQKVVKANLNPNFKNLQLQALKDCDYDRSTAVPAENLAALIEDPCSRRAAICRLIAWLIFARISVDSNADVSLLPVRVAQILQAMPPPECSSNNREGKEHMFSNCRKIR
jgi:hypothetical protein